MSEKETRREEEFKRAAKKVHVNLMKVNKLYQTLAIPQGRVTYCL
jgi:hypothetical protein